jgi:hypothetical protein
MKAKKKQKYGISGSSTKGRLIWLVWVDSKTQASAIAATRLKKWETFIGSVEKNRILKLFLMF